MFKLCIEFKKRQHEFKRDSMNLKMTAWINKNEWMHAEINLIYWIKITLKHPIILAVDILYLVINYIAFMEYSQRWKSQGVGLLHWATVTPSGDIYIEEKTGVL